MKFRFRAFGLHLAASASALAIVLGTLYLGWYRWPGWYLSGVLSVLGIVCLVDLALGPTLTLIIANPNKPRRELARDISVIVVVQLAALTYGASTLWQGRPLYYVYSIDSLNMVQASDLHDDEIAAALKENPAFAPHWYSGVRWVWAPLPDDPEIATKIAAGAVFGEQDVVEMPRYFRPYDAGLAELRKNLRPIASIKYLTPAQKASLADRVTRLGIAPARANAMVIWGMQGTRPLLMFFDPASLRIQAILRPDGGQ